MRIVLAGGGTGGHIFPNIAVFETLKEPQNNVKSSRNLRMMRAKGALAMKVPQDSRFEALYIGEKNGMEKNIAHRYGIPFRGIYAGKFRRYFSFQNFFDFLKIPAGFVQAFFLLMRFRPDVIFSKGGYVAVPVVVAGYVLRIPIVIHESDAIPGLATQICSRFALKICLAFEETKHYFPSQYQKKLVVTGIPLRKMILHADAARGRALCGFSENLPIVLVVGGSTGAMQLNTLVREMLPELLHECQIVHFTGKGKNEPCCDLGTFSTRYKTFESLDKEYADVLASADLVMSRAGANALFEFVALKKPSLLIPLGLDQSRGDQIENAKIFEKRGMSVVLDGTHLTSISIKKNIQNLLQHREKLLSLIKNLECYEAQYKKNPVCVENILARRE